jgi:hypothetical protein
MAGLALFWAVLLTIERISIARAQARDDAADALTDGGK